MRKPLLITAVAVVAVLATAALLWRPWEPRQTYLTDLVASDPQGYRVQAHDLVQEPSAGAGSVSYDLGGRFTTFETTVALRGRPAGSTVQVRISLDGNVEYEAEVVAEDAPRPVRLTVTGVRRITLSGGAPDSPATGLVWAGARLR